MLQGSEWPAKLKEIVFGVFLTPETFQDVQHCPNVGGIDDEGNEPEDKIIDLEKLVKFFKVDLPEP